MKSQNISAQLLMLAYRATKVYNWFFYFMLSHLTAWVFHENDTANRVLFDPFVMLRTHIIYAQTSTSGKIVLVQQKTITGIIKITN